MKLSIFADLWHKKHPGTLVKKGIGKTIELTFKPDGKVYKYTQAIQALAEYFELIPEIDFNLEAERVVSLLEECEKPIWALRGSVDTVRELWYKRNGENYAVIYGDAVRLDDYGREMNEFSLLARMDDPWASEAITC